MKKKILYFVVVGFLGSQEVFSVDVFANAFDIRMRSDHIVGSLWRGSEVSQKDITELFNLMNEKNKEQDIKEQKNIKEQIDSIISAYQESMMDTANHREEDVKNIDNIGKFINNVRALENEFPPQTIADGLSLISSKF